jgi:RNA polymerase sigma-70 factor (family 1)
MKCDMQRSYKMQGGAIESGKIELAPIFGPLMMDSATCYHNKNLLHFRQNLSVVKSIGSKFISNYAYLKIIYKIINSIRSTLMPPTGNNYLSDTILVANFLKDDEKAFNEIYTRYWHRLFIFALSKLNDQNTAEEVIQNVFVDLWQKRSTDEIVNLSAYLHRAVKNKCIDQIRRGMIRERHKELILSTTDEEGPGTEEMIAFQELKATINEALAALPEKTREIFTLNRLDGLSVREVSKVLSIPERTVEHHLASALKIMKFQLRDFMILLLILRL